MWWVFGLHFSLNKKNCDFFAALRISGRKTAAEDTHIVPCVVIIGERASLWVIVLVAKLMNQKMSLEPGESHSCAELMRKKDFIFFSGLEGKPKYWHCLYFLCVCSCHTGCIYTLVTVLSWNLMKFCVWKLGYVSSWSCFILSYHSVLSPHCWGCPKGVLYGAEMWRDGLLHCHSG